MAQTKGLELGVELGVGLPGAISTDARRLQQVLRNLLSNACKFTEKGRVDLRVGAGRGRLVGRSPRARPRRPRRGASPSSTPASGSPPDKLKIIFEPFQQADTGTGRMFGGTGLGLSISREIARLLGGEIRVRSTPGEGSTFTLYLPLAYQPPAHRPSSSPPDAGALARPAAELAAASSTPGPPPTPAAHPARRPSHRWTWAGTATTSSRATDSS